MQYIFLKPYKNLFSQTKEPTKPEFLTKPGIFFYKAYKIVCYFQAIVVLLKQNLQVVFSDNSKPKALAAMILR